MEIISLISITEAQVNQMPILRLGSQGDPVILVQQYLYRTGYYDGSIDGNFDLKTYDAIREFQKKVRIFPRGIVDRKTWLAILCYETYLKLQE
jgi:peptidoglycan hydrolase-like protein with peptidoglycan-binding domain